MDGVSGADLMEEALGLTESGLMGEALAGGEDECAKAEAQTMMARPVEESAPLQSSPEIQQDGMPRQYVFERDALDGDFGAAPAPNEMAATEKKLTPNTKAKKAKAPKESDIKAQSKAAEAGAAAGTTRTSGADTMSVPVETGKATSGGDGSAGGGDTDRRERWRPSKEQKALLMEMFKRNPYPSVAEKKEVALRMGIHKARVSKWFQHKRESLVRKGLFQGEKQPQRRSQEELTVLEASFLRNPYPSRNDMQDLAKELGNLSEAQIRLWFKHKRSSLVRSKSSRSVKSREASASQDTTPPVSSGGSAVGRMRSMNVGFVGAPSLGNEMRTSTIWLDPVQQHQLQMMYRQQQQQMLEQQRAHLHHLDEQARWHHVEQQIESSDR